MRYFVLLLIFIVEGCSPAVNIDKLTAEAGSGNLQAQYELARAYEAGNGVPKNFPKALELYTSAAERGFGPAQMTLGYFYQYGEGVPKNPEKALSWSRKAADQGAPQAAHNIGVMYDEGVDISEDNSQAIKWYTKAANAGFCPSLLNLGVMYHKGEGTPKDYEKAWNLLNEARLRCDQNIHWRAVNELDAIKQELGVAHPQGIGRFSFPSWEELQQAPKK